MGIINKISRSMTEAAADVAKFGNVEKTPGLMAAARADRLAAKAARKLRK